jgi:hypothetical protein
LEFELVTLEEYIVESPSLGGENGRDTHLTSLDLKSQVNCPHTSVSCRPRFSRSSVGSMTESTKRLTVDENLRNDIDSLVAGESQHFRNDGGRSEFDEDNVIETDSVERVLESHTSLNFVSLDHGFENVLHLEGFSSSCEVISDGEDSSQVVGRVTPFSSEETCRGTVRIRLFFDVGVSLTREHSQLFKK